MYCCNEAINLNQIIMEGKNWIPNVNEIVSWGCDAVEVMSVNFGGKANIKMVETGKYVKSVDISEFQKIA